MHNLQIYLFNLFIFLKNTDEPKKKKLMILVLLPNARQWYFGSKHKSIGFLHFIFTAKKAELQCYIASTFKIHQNMIQIYCIYPWVKLNC